MVKFRTAYNLLDYNDNEVYKPGTSETEQGQEVNVKTVYERCLRGEVPSLLASDYDIKGKMDLDDAFDTIDPTRSEDFDLADASAMQREIIQRLSAERSEATKADQIEAQLNEVSQENASGTKSPSEA